MILNIIKFENNGIFWFWESQYYAIISLFNIFHHHGGINMEILIFHFWI